MKYSKKVMQAVLNDDLTGLPTKEQHKAEAAAILKKRRNGEKYAYVMCDIVDFKLFNETYGYAYGNVALKHIAAVWMSKLKKGELLSRTTRDHFCMLLRYAEEEELKNRVLQLLEEAGEFPVDVNGGKHKASFRCGIYPAGEGEDINMIRSRADMARKSLEKCRESAIVFYDETDLAKELEKKELEQDLIKAVIEKELVVYYQPKYDILSERISGAEALIRWNHPEKGVIAPSAFVPLCEENGFVCKLDFYVLEEVCKWLNLCRKNRKSMIRISVNFSRRHLQDAFFVDKLSEMVKRYKLSPELIEIELTENIAYNETDRMLRAMHKIKEAGFGLSMDDFGTGYSSLNLLREMPVDVLKLDKGFLDDCSGDDSSREKRIISHVISMARDLEITVLAEGVETALQKEFLKDAHCDMIQGYFYAKPMPEEQFTEYLEQHQCMALRGKKWKYNRYPRVTRTRSNRAVTARIAGSVRMKAGVVVSSA